MQIEVMVYLRRSLLWAAILCCVANAEPLSAPAGTSRVLLNASSSATSQQDVSTSSLVSLSSSTLSDLSLSSSTFISTSIITSTSSSSSSFLIISTSSTPSILLGPLPPPNVNHDTSTTQTSASGETEPYTSLVLNSTTIGTSTSGNSMSSTFATSSTGSSNGVVDATAPVAGGSVPISPTSKATGTSSVNWGGSVPHSTVVVNPQTPASIATNNSETVTTASPSPSANHTVPITSTEDHPPTTTLLPPVEFNTSSTIPISSKYRKTTSTKLHSSTLRNSSTIPTTTPYSNVTTSTHIPTTSHLHHNTSSCIPITPGETITVWSIVPNTHTTTITLTGNQSNTHTSTPEFTPPNYCTPKPKSSSNKSTSTYLVPGTLPASVLPPYASSSSAVVVVGESAPPYSAGPSSSTGPPPELPWLVTSTAVSVSSAATTIVITSKNPVTSLTTQSVPGFPGDGKTEKQTVQPTTTSNTFEFTPLPPPHLTVGPTSTAQPDTGSGGGSPEISSIDIPSTTAVIGGVTVVAGGGSVVIGTQTVIPGSGNSGGSGSPGSQGGGLSATVTEGGQTFTVNPSQVIGPGTTISIPTNTGGVFMESPTPTAVNGVSVAVGNNVAVVGGSTFAIGAGAPEETIVVNKETISIGPGGIGFADVTITPAAAIPTNVVVFDGEVFSVIGASVAAFDGTSITFTPGETPVTTVFNGDTITIGPSGVVDGTSTLGGSGHPTGTQYGLAGGIYVSEVGSTLAVIDGTTLTIGPNATPTTETIEGHTVTAGPSGLTIGGSDGASTTLNFPFNPTTQEVTAGGVTFSEIGSSLVDIGGSTFTIGPGATPTTDVYNGQTISIGPGGIGFATTTITSFTSSPTATTTGKKKNVGALNGPPFRVLGACIALGVGLFV